MCPPLVLNKLLLLSSIIYIQLFFKFYTKFFTRTQLFLIFLWFRRYFDSYFNFSLHPCPAATLEETKYIPYVLKYLFLSLAWCIVSNFSFFFALLSCVSECFLLLKVTINKLMSRVTAFCCYSKHFSKTKTQTIIELNWDVCSFWEVDDDSEDIFHLLCVFLGICKYRKSFFPRQMFTTSRVSER